MSITTEHRPTPATHRDRAKLALRLLLAFLVLLTAVLYLGPGRAPAESDGATPPVPTGEPAEVELIVFGDEECPRCGELGRWLEGFLAEHPTVSVSEYDVRLDQDARDLFAATGEELGFHASSVPTVILDQRVWIGFTETVADDMGATIEAVLAGEPAPVGVYGSAGEGTCDDDELNCSGDEERVVSIPFFGDVNLNLHSLFVSTLIIGFVDGINPCSLWVISMLLAIVMRTGSRRRVMAIGSTFLFVTAGMYAIYMAGIYSFLTVVGYLGAIQIAVALIAGIFGAVSLKDYFAFKKGPSFTIKDSAKPGLYRRMREAAGHKKLLPALGATIVLAVLVSLLETPCTAGFPILWTGMLQANGVNFVEAAGLFVVYMVPFLIDEFVIFGVAVATMRAAKLQEKHGQALKLVAGVTMLTLAGAILVDPTLMEDPVAALVLFLAAFAASDIIHVVTTQVRARRATQQELAAGVGTG